jgi:hypothetical protein
MHGKEDKKYCFQEPVPELVISAVGCSKVYMSEI